MRGLIPQAISVITIILLCISRSHGRHLDRSRLEISVNHAKESYFVPRDDLRKCSAPVPVVSRKRRDLGLYNEANGTDHASALMRRVMQLPDGTDKLSMNEFMDVEIAKAAGVVFQNKAGSDFNTALLEDFAGAAVSAGVTGLCGCTTLVILSRMGYFIAHYWESISFSPDPVWKFKDDQDAFKKTIEIPLTQGAGGYMRRAHPRLGSAASSFSGDDVRAFLIKPSINIHSDPNGYRWQWDKMKTIIGGILPALDPTQYASRWQEITYTKLDRDDAALDDTAAGRTLIKYDPDHPEDSKRNKLTLWVEWQQVYNDEWSN
ncbi:hypothetical protein AMS68_006754 [Peltaster fructicola]|uniref:WIF domain-containing protein n=1 Tax=Peltaster fructicola TaxID=286661 RepID=A0A6H0Y2K3_9PEZI|nr:hypothetical protein AMS68_006754 [Peltaster fructicola]